MSAVNSRRARTALVLVTSAVALVACGDDDDDAGNPLSDDAAITVADATDAPDTTTAPTDAPATTVPVTTAAEPGTTAAPATTVSVESTELVDGFRFTSPDGVYTVVFPAEPDEQVQEAPTGGGDTVSVTSHFVEVDQRAFGVSEFKVPGDSPYSLEDGRDGSLAAVGGSVQSSDEITQQGRDGIEYSGRVTSNDVTGTYLSRIFTDGELVHQVVVVGPGEISFDDADVVAFFDSFTFSEG